ncbi:MAG: hypothetical protein JJU28_15065 [Cyclobacteriaceae bacterium]|nr:hypothetical protein [Cyclobacteriaceae bacterium]
MFRKSSLYFCIFFVLFSSACTRYQYALIESPLPKNEDSSYLYENDTFSILYSFNGKNGPLQITFTNKSTQPLFIDWSRSAYIANGHQHSVWEEGSGQSAITQIAPKAQDSFIRRYLSVGFIELPEFQKQKSTLNTNTGKVNAELYDYKQEDSPLKFSVYLTIANDIGFKNPIGLTHDFWLKEVNNTMASPGTLTSYGKNQFHNQKMSAGGHLITIGAIAGVIIVLIAIAPQGEYN